MAALTDSMVNETNIRIQLFADCVRHINAIARVLAQSRGHMLLVGPGGSG